MQSLAAARGHPSPRENSMCRRPAQTFSHLTLLSLSGKKGPQRSPSWACGLTITRLLVTGLQLPFAHCPHPHVWAQGPSSWS